MFDQMIDGTLSVLRFPSVASFKKYSGSSLAQATIYMAITTFVSTILAALGYVAKAPMIEQQARQYEQQFGQSSLMSMLLVQTLSGTIIFTIVTVFIGFFITAGIIYGLARAFGGTGTFGEFCYALSLFVAPLTILSHAVNVIAVGTVLGCIVALVSLGILGYNIYLTYLALQSTMNLSQSKARTVIGILVGLGVVLAIGGIAVSVSLFLQNMPSAR